MSTFRNAEAGPVNTIPVSPAETRTGGELVPVGQTYGLAPYSAGVWPGGPTPRPEFLTAGPDPMSLLRALRRRWLLATGMGILVGTVAAIAAYALIPEKEEVVAYIRVLRTPVNMMNETRQSDGHEFTTYRNTQMELIRGRFVISRALRDPAIGQLPLIKAQPDAVSWLEGELQLDYPGDAEIMRVRMRGEEPGQLVKIVNAVVDAYFREIVEGEAMQRRKRHDDLQQKYDECNTKLLAQMKNIETLAAQLGALDPTSVGVRNQMIASELGSLRVDLSNSISRKAETDLEIMGIEQEIDLAKDPSASAAKIDAKINEDKKVIELEETLARYDGYLAQLEGLSKGKETPSLQRERKSRADMQERLDTRKAELQEKFANLTSADRVKELQAKLKLAKKRLETLEEHIAAKQKEFDEQSKAIKVFSGNSAELENLKKQLEGQAAVRDQMSRELATRNIEAGAPPRVQRLEEAIAPEGSSSFNKFLMIGFAGVAGFCLVGLTVSFVEFQARRISSSTQLADGLGMRVVGALPSIARPGRKALAGGGGMQGLLMESIDHVRTNLIHSPGSEPVRVVMVTSALDREGKTTVASQLAASLARCGRRTLLIDGDLRRPTAHRLFELPLEPGCCELLRGEVELDDVVRPTRVAGLWMIAAGQYDLESIQALSREGLAELFDALRSRFDFIIVDSAPVLSIADASMLGQQVDAAILSVMREVSQAAKVFEASEQLRSVGVQVLGAVINGERTAATYRSYAARSK